MRNCSLGSVWLQLARTLPVVQPQIILDTSVERFGCGTVAWDQGGYIWTGCTRLAFEKKIACLVKDIDC